MKEIYHEGKKLSENHLFSVLFALTFVLALSLFTSLKKNVRHFQKTEVNKHIMKVKTKMKHHEEANGSEHNSLMIVYSSFFSALFKEKGETATHK